MMKAIKAMVCVTLMMTSGRKGYRVLSVPLNLSSNMSSVEVSMSPCGLKLKSVFQTAAFAGYPRVSFMVNKAASH